MGRKKEPEAGPKRARYRPDGEKRIPKVFNLRPDIEARFVAKAERRGISQNALMEELLIAAGFGKPEPESKT